MNDLKVVDDCDGLMDVPQAAQYLGIKTSSLYQKCMKKEIRYVKLGKLNRFRKKDLDKYIDDNLIEVNQFD